jgi:serpin B
MRRFVLAAGGMLVLSAVVSAASVPEGGFGVRSVTARSDDRRAVVRGNTEFALDLYGELRAAPGNFVFSPLSVSTAMAMTMEGAAGRTRSELAAATHLSLPQARLPRAFQSVLAALAPREEGVTLAVANGLFVDDDVAVRQRFRAALSRHYGARGDSVDFEAGGLGAINDWASDATHGLIPEAIPADFSLANTELVLANALHFDGKWQTRFPTETDGVFRTSPDTVAIARFMSVETELPRLVAPGLRAVEIPYRGGEYAMDVFVPEAADGLPAFEESLTRQRLSELLDAMQPEHIDLRMPSFEFGSSLDLAAPLRSLGVERAFDEGTADFSAATGERRGVRLSPVRQKATIRVDQDGTVAAVVTTSGQSQSAAADPETFRVDRPFLFVVRHLTTGSILLLGRVTDPTQHGD